MRASAMLSLVAACGLAYAEEDAAPPATSAPQPVAPAQPVQPVGPAQPLAPPSPGAATTSPSAEAPPQHTLPAARAGGTVVGLCDGKTSVEVPVAPGHELTREQAQAASDQLMSEWRRQNPNANWQEAPREPREKDSGKVVQNTIRQDAAGDGPVNNASGRRRRGRTGAQGAAGKGPAGAPGHGGQVGTYNNYTARDELVWQAETQKFVDEGNAVFHDAKKLGGTIGVSCDMCHPNAANTHPETYPKYQVQLQRVALLRDMINWCIENPLKGKPLPDDDRRLRAVEAYILAQRKGVKLEPGKH